jgi:hypothetical protein
LARRHDRESGDQQHTPAYKRGEPGSHTNCDYGGCRRDGGSRDHGPDIQDSSVSLGAH